MLPEQLNKIKEDLESKSYLTDAQKNLLDELMFVARIRWDSGIGVKEKFNEKHEKRVIKEATGIADNYCKCCGRKY